jgi:hypothetical protein
MIQGLMMQWWLWSVVCGSVLLMVCGMQRFRLATAPKPVQKLSKSEVWAMADEQERKTLQEIEGQGLGEYREVDGFGSNLPEVLGDLQQETGLTAWRIKNREIARRKRQSEVIGAEIETAKKQIEYIRTLAERSSVVDEEKLRIAKLKQEMRRFTQEEARGDLEDQLARKRMEKELAELERDIRELSRESEPPKPKSEAEKRAEILQREQEKHAFEIEMQKQKAKQAVAARQALVDAMNAEVTAIEENPSYTPAQKQQLIETVEDSYQALIARLD